jgi:hypothetical protein
LTQVRKALTFSNIVACLALFIALGGSVYAAGKINGKQIKPSSLPGNRLKAKTITAHRIKPNTLTGQQVKDGALTGKEINQGTLTGISAAALASVHYETVTMSLPGDSRPATATANCPSGTNAIGGGATVSNDERVVVNDIGPSPLRTGWEATAFSWWDGTSVTVTAVCVTVGKPGGSVNTVPGPTPNPKGPIYVPFG